MPDNKYYVSSFFWSTVTKILNALIGFISVPLLLGIYNKADYGIISLAMSFNAYLHLLDLGMNTGAVKFYSQWREEGKLDLINKVAHTNISFYLLLAIINTVIMICLGFFGENLFSISGQQFSILRNCLFIIAGFSIFNWVTTAFNQLLISDMQMAFTQKMQFVQVLLKAAAIALVLVFKWRIEVYFFILTAIVASLVIPYACKCLKDNLIDSLYPKLYLKEFNVVLVFSLSLFALSIFQITATESRAIILGIFNKDGADTVADFKILSVVPSLIITIGGTLSAIFLPGASGLVAKNNKSSIENFAYKWTRLTSIIANLLCIPFILCAKEVLTAYVGKSYAGLDIWLILWCLTSLIQIHTTPGNSLVIAYGKTLPLVITSAFACILSIILNAALAPTLGAGSAVIGYLVYVIIVIGLYYLIYYKKLIGLKRSQMLKSFLAPTILGFIAYAFAQLVKITPEMFAGMNERLALIFICIIKTLIWLIPYTALLLSTGTLKINEIKSLKIKG